MADRERDSAILADRKVGASLRQDAERAGVVPNTVRAVQERKASETAHPPAARIVQHQENLSRRRAQALAALDAPVRLNEGHSSASPLWSSGIASDALR